MRDVSSLARPTSVPLVADGVRVQRIQDVVGLHALRAEWSALLESSTSNCVFLTWEWLATWWKHLGAGRRLDLLAVRHGDELIGLAPLMVGPRPGGLVPFRARQFLGSGSVGSDYLDVILKTGREREALDALTAKVAEDGLMLDLAQINRRAAIAPSLAERLKRIDWQVTERPGDVCPFVDLAGHTWSSYLASLARGHRYNVRRRLDQLARQRAMRFELVESETRRREALATLVTLHMRRWSERGGSTALHATGLVAFHEEFSRLALQRGWLRLFVMHLAGEPVAALYGLRYGHTFCFYQSGFDPAHRRYGVGQVIL